MFKQTELMLVEEFSELELEAISGGKTTNNQQGGVVNVGVGNVEVIKNSPIQVVVIGDDNKNN
jgi:hypothetical protein